MWGNISTEASYQLNFNTGFSTTRSDVLVHLAQWQYWWWFWFAFIWCFYYLLSSRIIRYRVLKMKPKIYTSYRPHGKWGDFIAAVIPGLWVLNILTNSNFILRLIEWQNESSLFTVRIRARQWYWIYKFELKNIVDILVSPKNLGYNRWLLNTFGDLTVSDNYLHILNLRAQNKWIKGYWNILANNYSKVNQQNINLTQEFYKFSNYNKNSIFLDNVIIKKNSKFSFNFINFKNNNKNFFFNSFFYNNINFKKYFSQINDTNLLFNDTLDFSNGKTVSFLNLNTTKNISIFNKLYKLVNNENTIKNTSMNMYSDFLKSSRNIKKSAGLILPFRTIKYQIQFSDLNDTFLWREKAPITLFTHRFGKGKNYLVEKPLLNAIYLTIKQKKYKTRKSIPLLTKMLKDENDFTKKIKFSSKPVLLNNSFFYNDFNDPTTLYRMIKKNKVKSDVIPVTLARRLLRTKRTLVLPAHINITLITNSFDVVHSWFIPGLGIKLDCIPGRSTHHTFYIDSVGFYYGQCAEICGRYHHHMPIRICALPFEHFLVWWHTFGLPKLLFTNSQKRFESNYSFRKFVW